MIPVINYFLFCTFRRVFELFNNACSRALQCGAEICIDETLYANRGRGFSFKQYLPLKPSKYGFLFKSLGDSKHAYIYRSLIYAGRPAEEATEHYVKGNKNKNKCTFTLSHIVFFLNRGGGSPSGIKVGCRTNLEIREIHRNKST